MARRGDGIYQRGKTSPSFLLALALLGGLAAVGAPFTGAASADVVELKSGQKVEGTFKGADDSAVRIEIGGQVLTFKLDEVRAIYFGPMPARLALPLRDEAMRALKGLRSVTSGGTTYREYLTRVSDAKIVVDRYLEGSSGGSSERPAISDAMGFYAVAGVVWGAVISRRHVAPQELGMLPKEGCRHATAQNEIFRGMWTCASEKITEAERLIGDSK